MAAKLLRVLVTALLVAAAVSVDARLVVRMVQVAHRHGARGPLMAENTTQICGSLYPCGELTGEGIDMLNTVGQFARSRYNDPAVVESPLFPSTRYNSSVVYTRSTGIQRTIQSATAFLSGLFPDRYFYPVVYSHNITTDTLLNTDPVPFIMARRWLDDAALNAVLNPAVDQYLTWPEMQAAAKDAWIEGMCSDYNSRSDCAAFLHDVATAFEAAGRLDNATNLNAVFPGLKEVNAAWYRYVFGWNDANELDRAQGTAGQNLAQTMLANINAYRLAPSYKMFEYSTHDVMLAPLAVTLGDQGYTTLRPSYGVSIFVELLQDTADASGWYVRLLRGHPEKAADGNYVFQQSGIQVHCIDAAGNMYLATTGICPLDNFRRMIDYSRPNVVDGNCMMTPTQYANMNCPRTIANNRPVPPRCWVYRYVCVNKACPNTYVLSVADYQCYPTADTQVSSSSSSSSSPAPPAPPAFLRPMNWAPRVMSQEKRYRIANGLLRGVTNGLTLGTAIRKHNA
ncbi:histidine secretory acid phosphatase [Novymonas esmeraldas]|uniref:Histidine secretory acid phosphatase n=1 Tax=Novymonas esmeraldas TaxID=1808958 RepID=A0AAW0FAQ8_9TRYP